MGTPRLVILRPRHIRHIRHTLTSRHVRTSHIHVQKWVVTVQRISQSRQTRSQRINLRSLSNKTEVTRLQRRTAVARTDRLKKKTRLNGNLVMIQSKQELTNNDTIIYRNLSSSTSARDVIIYVIMTSSAGLT